MKPAVNSYRAERTTFQASPLAKGLRFPVYEGRGKLRREHCRQCVDVHASPFPQWAGY